MTVTIIDKKTSNKNKSANNDSIKNSDTKSTPNKSPNKLMDKTMQTPRIRITRSKATLTKTISPNTQLASKYINNANKVHKKQKLISEIKNPSIGTQTHDNVTCTSRMSQTVCNSTSITTTCELLGKNWLSDLSIQPYFETLNIMFLEKNSSVIINPIVSHAIKNVVDFEHFVDNLDLYNKEVIIFPVNDSQVLNQVGGTHWSLLIYIKASNCYYHYDSLGNSNFNSAKTIASKVTAYMRGGDGPLNIVDLVGPRQLNTYDCGVYGLSRRAGNL